MPEAVSEAICSLARSKGLPVHLDGARLFNAAVASGRTAAQLAAPFDSVMFCLSKGLGAPVGSILAGSARFIEDALRARKRFGGGMRQAGILAAAGIVALQENIPRLAEDHQNARRLGERIAALPGLEIDLSTLETNIIVFRVRLSGFPAPKLVEQWKTEGVLALPLDDTQVRAVTHYDVSREQVDFAGDRLESVLRSVGR